MERSIRLMNQVAGTGTRRGVVQFANFVEIVNISYCEDKLVVLKYLREAYFHVFVFGYSAVDNVWGRQINVDELYECQTKR